MKNKLVKLLVLFHIILFIICLYCRQFEIIPFAIFNISFCALSILSLKKNQLKSVLFLGIMLWLGFYLKISIHSILNYKYVEPIGNFLHTPSEWSQVFLIASTGILGFLASSISFNYIRSLLPIRSDENNKNVIKHDFLYFGLPLLILGISCAILNFKLEMTMSGLFPKTILPFHLNAIIGWLLLQGLIILACVYTNIELVNKKKINKGFFISITLASFSSLSIISRGLFLFQILPFLEAMRSNIRHKFSKKMLIKYSVISFIVFILISTISNSIRNKFYDQIFLQQDIISNNLKIKKSLLQISKLTIDRWIGAEGLMAVSTYERRNLNLMTSTLMRKLKPGELDIYSEISNSYKNINQKYFFTSLPGIISFLYYSNSLIIVLFGMFLIGFFIQLIEVIIDIYFTNIFLTAQIGFYLANGIAQFGISPRPLFISFFMTASFFFFLYAVQKYLTKISNFS